MRPDQGVRVGLEAWYSKKRPSCAFCSCHIVSLYQIYVLSPFLVHLLPIAKFSITKATKDKKPLALCTATMTAASNFHGLDLCPLVGLNIVAERLLSTPKILWVCLSPACRKNTLIIMVCRRKPARLFISWRQNCTSVEVACFLKL